MTLRHTDPRYVFDPDAGRYRYRTTGRLVPTAVITRGLENAIASEEEHARELAKAMQEGDLTPLQFEREMAKVVSNTQYYSAAAGLGGWEQMTTADAQFVEQQIDEQMSWLKALTKDLRAGLPRDGQFFQRAASYARAGRTTFYIADTETKFAAGMTRVWNVLHPADHCEGDGSCLEQTDLGKVAIDDPRLIPPGQRRCRGNCLCTWEYDDGPVEGEEEDAQGFAVRLAPKAAGATRTRRAPRARPVPVHRKAATAPELPPKFTVDENLFGDTSRFVVRPSPDRRGPITSGGPGKATRLWEQAQSMDATFPATTRAKLTAELGKLQQVMAESLRTMNDPNVDPDERGNASFRHDEAVDKMRDIVTTWAEKIVKDAVNIADPDLRPTSWGHADLQPGVGAQTSPDDWSIEINRDFVPDIANFLMGYRTEREWAALNTIIHEAMHVASHLDLAEYTKEGGQFLEEMSTEQVSEHVADKLWGDAPLPENRFTYAGYRDLGATMEAIEKASPGMADAVWSNFTTAERMTAFTKAVDAWVDKDLVPALKATGQDTSGFESAYAAADTVRRYQMAAYMVPKFFGDIRAIQAHPDNLIAKERASDITERMRSLLAAPGTGPVLIRNFLPHDELAPTGNEFVLRFGDVKPFTPDKDSILTLMESHPPGPGIVESGADPRGAITRGAPSSYFRPGEAEATTVNGIATNIVDRAKPFDEVFSESERKGLLDNLTRLAAATAGGPEAHQTTLAERTEYFKNVEELGKEVAFWAKQIITEAVDPPKGFEPSKVVIDPDMGSDTGAITNPHDWSIAINGTLAQDLANFLAGGRTARDWGALNVVVHEAMHVASPFHDHFAEYADEKGNFLEENFSERVSEHVTDKLWGTTPLPEDRFTYAGYRDFVAPLDAYLKVTPGLTDAVWSQDTAAHRAAEFAKGVKAWVKEEFLPTAAAAGISQARIDDFTKTLDTATDFHVYRLGAWRIPDIWLDIVSLTGAKQDELKDATDEVTGIMRSMESALTGGVLKFPAESPERFDTSALDAAAPETFPKTTVVGDGTAATYQRDIQPLTAIPALATPMSAADATKALDDAAPVSVPNLIADLIPGSADKTDEQWVFKDLGAYYGLNKVTSNGTIELDQSIYYGLRQFLQGERNQLAYQAVATVLHERLHTLSPMMSEGGVEYPKLWGQETEESLTEAIARRLADAVWDGPLPPDRFAKGGYPTWTSQVEAFEHADPGFIDLAWDTTSAADRADIFRDATGQWILKDVIPRLKALGVEDDDHALRVLSVVARPESAGAMSTNAAMNLFSSGKVASALKIIGRLEENRAAQLERMRASGAGTFFIDELNREVANSATNAAETIATALRGTLSIQEINEMAAHVTPAEVGDVVVAPPVHFGNLFDLPPLSTELKKVDVATRQATVPVTPVDDRPYNTDGGLGKRILDRIGTISDAMTPTQQAAYNARLQELDVLLQKAKDAGLTDSLTDFVRNAGMGSPVALTQDISEKATSIVKDFLDDLNNLVLKPDVDETPAKVRLRDLGEAIGAQVDPVSNLSLDPLTGATIATSGNVQKYVMTINARIVPDLLNFIAGHRTWREWGALETLIHEQFHIMSGISQDKDQYSDRSGQITEETSVEGMARRAVDKVWGDTPLPGDRHRFSGYRDVMPTFEAIEDARPGTLDGIYSTDTADGRKQVFALGVGDYIRQELVPALTNAGAKDDDVQRILAAIREADADVRFKFGYFSLPRVLDKIQDLKAGTLDEDAIAALAEFVGEKLEG
jgi:hypothetical protein